MIAVALAACVFYRKRQRERAQLLARQLRLTERRIDAVGSIWEKREKDAADKQTYYPPTDVKASASEPSLVTRTAVDGARPHYVIRSFQPRLVPLRPVGDAGRKIRVQTSLVNSSVCSCDYGVETCSMCSVDAANMRRKDAASDGSLAVELDTVPSLSSIKTQQQEVIRRTKSDTATTPGGESVARRSLQMDETYLVHREESTPNRNVIEWMEKSMTNRMTNHSLPPPPPSLEPAYTETEDYMSTVATSTNEQEPPPNTPVSRSLLTESEITAPAEKILSFISEDAQSEEWV